MSALLHKQIRELTEAVAELRRNLAELRAQGEKLAQVPVPEKRPVGRPPKVRQ